MPSTISRPGDGQPLICTVGALVELLNCRSLAGVMFKNMSFRFPATVMPLTG